MGMDRKVTLAEQFSGILDIQKREVELNPNDDYHRGLYNGMLMMCANADNTEFKPIPKPCSQPA